MARLDKTLADYVAIAISPVLIMLMVGSLMYFLVAATYVGNYDARIYWILSCYTLAIVLIARISIEEGQDRAMLFGGALAVVTGLAVMRFSDAVLVPWFILGVVWWVAHKLTWDCTLIDENQDSSGQGLLGLVGLGREKKRGGGRAPDGRAPGDSAEKTPAEPEGVTARVSQMRTEAHSRRGSRGKAHAPGVWIVYFSLAALPLFGLGQVLLPAADLEGRRWAFQLLVVYVASGLGLLLTTSFLGLRRYLRQRSVEMPAEMAGVWIGLGAALILALLLVAALLPRPAAEYAISEFPLKFTTPPRDSSRYAVGNDGADQNQPDSPANAQEEQNEEGDSTRQGDESSPSGDESSPSRDESSQEDSSESREDSGEPSGPRREQKQDPRESQGREQGAEESPRREQDSQGAEKSPRRERDSQGTEESPRRERDSQGTEQSPRRERDSQNAEESPRREEDSEGSRTSPQRQQDTKPSSPARSGRQSPGASRPPQAPREPWFRLPRVSLSLGGFFKLILYVLLLAIVGYFLWRSRERVAAAIQQFLRELREFWARLFGRGAAETGQAAEEETPAPRRLRPFAEYVDPFASGRADRLGPDEVVRYTFEALQAWARENGCPRQPDQTPAEFARQVGRHEDRLAAGARTLADLYSRVAYASGRLDARNLGPLRSFWQTLRSTAAVAVASEPSDPRPPGRGPS